MSPSKGNFNDLDKDGYLDGWGANRLTNAAADTALLWRNTGYETAGHNGTRAYYMNWSSSAAHTRWFGSSTNSLRPWYHHRAVLASFPPSGGDWMARFEMWVAADTTGTGYAIGTTPDSVGVVFGFPIERYWLRHGSGTQTFSFGYDANGQSPDYASTDLYSSTQPGNTFMVGRWNELSATNNPRPFRWLHVVTEAKVPPLADYVLVSIWKDADIPAGGLIISDYSLTFYRR
jgi:hypothetical protein